MCVRDLQATEEGRQAMSEPVEPKITVDDLLRNPRPVPRVARP